MILMQAAGIAVTVVFSFGRVLLLSLLLMPATTVRAQDAGAQPPPVRLAGQIDLVRVLELAAARKGIPIQYPDEIARHGFTVRTAISMSDDEIWLLALGLLQAQGYVVVDVAGGHGMSVVQTSQAAAVARTLAPNETSDASYRVQAFELSYVSPAQVEQAVQPLLSSQAGAFRHIPGTARIILADLSVRVGEAARLIQQIDVPNAAAETRFVSLVSTKITEVIAQSMSIHARRQELIGQPASRATLVPIPDRSGVLVIAQKGEIPEWVELLRQLDFDEPFMTREYSTRGFDIDEVADLLEDSLSLQDGVSERQWRIIRNTISGAIVLTGSVHQHAIAAEFLERLGSIPEAERTPSLMVVAQHRAAADVADILAQLVQSDRGTSPGEATDRVEIARGGGDSAQFVVDESVNTIHISAPRSVLDRIKRLLPSVDVRLPQVQVEVLLVSVSESQARDLGVELQQLLDDAGTIAGLSSLFGLSTLRIDATDPLIGGAGSSVVVLDPGNFSVVIRALESVNDGRTLSMPKVLVNNNEDATIDSVLQQPFISTNAGDTISTTSFGGFEDAGTQVTVTPQIAAGDHLVLRYSINLSSFVGDSASPEAPPPRQQNSISSVATIPDGFTVVVGGIELQTQGYGEDRLPMLGNIPLLGNLFKSTSKSRSRQRFYAFIRATTMRDHGFEDLKYLSAVAADEAGIDDGWPEVEPRIIR